MPDLPVLSNYQYFQFQQAIRSNFGTYPKLSPSDIESILGTSPKCRRNREENKCTYTFKNKKIIIRYWNGLIIDWSSR